MSKALFDEDSGGEEASFQTNKEFAKSYNKNRQKELLKKLKDKDNGDGSDSSSDSDSSEDEEAVFNPKFDQEFYKTLSSLKRKDDAIYEQSTKFFEDEHILEKASGSEVTKDKEKKLTIKQYEQDILLKNAGKYDEDDESEGETSNKRSQSPTYNEEQNMLKSEFKKVLNSDNSDDEDDFGGMFTKRQKTKAEQAKDDENQEKWLVEHEEIKSKSIDEIWSNSKLSKDDKFLRDYILSNGYADKEDDEIPTYDEIVADDDFEEKQTEFEHKYNFRYEDPDQEFIKRYPRTIENSVRKVDTRRKEKRDERRERKDREKKEKFSEIEMLKELKRKEIEEKMAQLKAVTGADEINMEDIDLDDDFDPDEYDKKMNKIFNSEYYDVDEGDEKPECPSDIEDLKVENYDEYEPDANAVHCEDDEFNMDCDYDQTAEGQKKSFQEEIIESTRGRRKRKRKSKFMEMLESKKPTFNPDDDKSYGQHLDEYYNLDCEDIIGDVKCRFKYVETVPCDYGLSIEEILLAKNKELNAWASLKKTTQIRPEHVEKNDQAIFQKKSRNEMLKRKILCSLFEPSEDEEEPEVRVANKPMEMIKSENLGKDNCQTMVNQKDTKKMKQIKKQNVNTSTSWKESTLEEVPSTSTTKSEEKPSTSTKPEEKPSTSAKPVATETATIIQPKKNVVQRKSPSKPSLEKRPSNPLGSKKPGGNKAVIKFNDKKKQKIELKKIAHKTIDKTNTNQKTKGFSDERLKAFGINPKKFAKHLKYGPNNANAQQKGPIKKTDNKTGPKTNTKFESKLKSKLKKALKV